MKYSLESTKAKFESGERMKYLFFWGHTKKRDISKSCFSQWYESSFEQDGILYKTAEHWMMAEKAKLFGDDEMFQRIVECRTPAEAKKMGRKVRGFDHQMWEAEKYEIVVKGNLYKFHQNPNLAKFLKNTNSRILVEASPVDPIWGIGMAQDHKDVENPNCWRGPNLLGFALMEVRDLLNEKNK